jgi:hypothetical protein
MRNRLLITLALGLLGAVLVAGAVSAEDINLGVGQADVSIDLPDGGDLPGVGGVIPQCSNGNDDDGDGSADLSDAGCSSPTDPDESDEPVVEEPTSEEPTTEEPVEGGEQESGSGSEGGKLPDVDNPFEGDKNVKFEGDEGEGEAKPEGDKRKPDKAPEIRKPDGTPTNANPSTTIAPFGPAPIGVPNFIIDDFSIPPFLLPIYQACGTQYGIPWQILASINRIETAFGTNLNVSTAGALGWMQFMPPTWEAYGVDANRDGRKDPYNPVDAICAAARYLKASGGMDDLRGAIFAYNHADWYVDEVLLYAEQYGKLPSGIVDSLTGLTEGAHFPVAAKARYADDISERAAAKRSTPQKGSSGNAADVISESPTRRGINIYADEGAPIVAVNDGVVKELGKSKQLGNYIVLEDGYGNEFTYAGVGKIAEAIPVPKERELSRDDFDLVRPGKGVVGGAADKAEEASGPENTEDSRERVYALPQREANVARADLSGQLDALLDDSVPGYETFKAYFTGVLRFDSKTMEAKSLREGSKVVAGTVLGEIGTNDAGLAPNLHFAIEPAGKGSRKIDPKPILDGWKLLEATAIYRAAGKDPFDRSADVGQVLLMSKGQLIQRVLNDPGIVVYSCGREDIRTGQIDRRVLASLAYLSARGFRPTVTSLKCGRSGIYTTSGNVSAHVTGDAVDIAQINGLPILGNQGRGSITEAVVLDLLKLQGSMLPAQIITLMEMGGPTFAMGDHADHIHVGYTPDTTYDEGGKATYSSFLEPDQWDKLLDRIGELDQPTVPTSPSEYSLPSDNRKKRASSAHIGE